MPTVMLLTLIAVAVGDELALAHPGDEPWLGFSSLVLGGPALSLVGQVWGLRAMTGRFHASRLAAVAAVAGSTAVLVAPAIPTR